MNGLKAHPPIPSIQLTLPSFRFSPYVNFSNTLILNYTVKYVNVNDFEIQRKVISFCSNKRPVMHEESIHAGTSILLTLLHCI
jgi:hypothetical protein